jgi:hypothetical protein
MVASPVALRLDVRGEVGMARGTDTYILVRVKLKSVVVEALKAAAREETERTGRFVYVSNLIREALRDWLRARTRL